MFFLPEHVRGQSQGSRLLAAVENEAIRRGCKRAVVETSSFQAPGFYERHGYREFGRVEFGVPGARVFSPKEPCPQLLIVLPSLRVSEANIVNTSS